jgi:hypothetical protein
MTISLGNQTIKFAPPGKAVLEQINRLLSFDYDADRTENQKLREKHSHTDSKVIS